jgi:hypothetical protein
MRSNTTQQNIWAQLGVSACALLLPPMALGAAVFSMLPTRDQGIGRPVPGATAETHVTTPKFQAKDAWPANADSQPVAEAPELVFATGKPAASADGRGPASSANARQEPASKKDTARVLGPVPVRVTIVTPPAAANPPPSADADNTTTGSIGAAPWPAAAVEVPTSLLPRVPPGPVLILPPQRPAAQAPTTQVSAPQVSALQAPAAGRPSAEAAPAPASTARKQMRPSYLRTLAAHGGAHAEARSEARTIRRNVQPQPQQEFSFKNWLQQLGTRQRDTRG